MNVPKADSERSAVLQSILREAWRWRGDMDSGAGTGRKPNKCTDSSKNPRKGQWLSLWRRLETTQGDFSTPFRRGLRAVPGERKSQALLAPL